MFSPNKFPYLPIDSLYLTPAPNPKYTTGEVYNISYVIPSISDPTISYLLDEKSVTTSGKKIETAGTKGVTYNFTANSSVYYDLSGTSSLLSQRMVAAPVVGDTEVIISEFKSDYQIVNKGTQSFILSWSVSGIYPDGTLYLTGGGSTQDVKSKTSIQISSINESTTYTLTATSEDGSQEQKKDVPIAIRSPLSDIVKYLIIAVAAIAIIIVLQFIFRLFAKR